MRRGRSPLSIAVVLVLNSLIASVTVAQSETERLDRLLERIREETRIRPDPRIPPEQRLYLDYGAYVTGYYISFDDPEDNNRTIWQEDLTLYARLNLDGANELFIRGLASHRDFSAGDVFGERCDTRLERAYWLSDLGRAAAAYGRGTRQEIAVRIKAGRDLIDWANGLTLSQTLDGVSVALSRGPVAAELIAGLSAPDTIDIDTSRPDFEDETQRGFFGALVAVRAGNHRPFIYFLAQRDYNDDVLRLRSPGIPDEIPDPPDVIIDTRFDYNSYYIGFGSTGNIGDHFLYSAELVYEGGTTKSNSFAVGDEGQLLPAEQTTDRITAFAFDVRADVLLADVRRTQFGAELILASGDDDRGHTTNTFAGNAPGTTDRAFNGFGLLNTGLAFAPEASNLISVRAGVSSFPLADTAAFRNLQVGIDAFVFHKFDERAPIDEPTRDGRYLGWEPDLFVNWRVTSDLTFTARYGIFFPGDAIESDESRQFLLLGMTFGF